MADLLSRSPVLEYFENEDVIQVVNLIEKPEIIQDQNGNIAELKAAKKTERRHGITYKKLNDKSRIFVSGKFGLKIIKKVHEYYGHIGVAKLKEKIRPFYYFKNFDQLIEEFCKGCSICVENKTRRSRVIGLLSKLGPATEPFQIISIDTVGGFAGNKSPKKYMHILVDHFSRYAWISSTKSQCATDFINLIDPIVKRNNIKIILADQYTGINSSELKKYLTRMKIQIVFTCVDCPQSNGLNERLNQTLVNRIRCKFNSGDKRAWSVIADECVN